MRGTLRDTISSLWGIGTAARSTAAGFPNPGSSTWTRSTPSLSIYDNNTRDLDDVRQKLALITHKLDAVSGQLERNAEKLDVVHVDVIRNQGHLQGLHTQMTTLGAWVRDAPRSGGISASLFLIGATLIVFVILLIIRVLLW